MILRKTHQMNERFKQLALQAGFDWALKRSSLYGHDDDKQNLENFAELIIQEAGEAFWSEACNMSDLAYDEYYRNSKKIRQHFGFEK